MPQPLKHDLFMAGNRRHQAKQDFVSGLRAFILNDMANGMKSRYEQGIAPALEQHGQTPADGPAVHNALKDDLYFKFYSSMRYNTQEMVWRSVQHPIEENLDTLQSQASKYLEQEDSAGSSLKLDPDLKLPSNVADIDVHLAPGAYHEEICADDVSAGAVYDHGFNVFSFGMMGENHDDIGHSMANYIKVKFPDFQPRDILDMGCTIGHNTCAWAKTFPDARTTGIDVAAASLRYAHARARSQDCPVHFRQMDATTMSFEDNSFDVVFSSMFLHELPKKGILSTLREAHRVLRPGGILLNMELPPNSELSPYDSFYLDWDAYYNNEPYYKKFRDQNFFSLLSEAGFQDEKHLSFITPQYTYMSHDDYVQAVTSTGDFDENTGRLAEGVQWFGFGSWK
ncbi:MAG: class I SAM-dependent methyltransferase [Gammaproteobacteria bacterium]|nr:class I SAM-dependent methyltransferase [Gammaproteobacteria bacterium]